MFNSISVHAAPISGVMTADIFLRFGDAGASTDECSGELSTPEAWSISDIPRFVFVIRLLSEVFGESRPRGVEVTFPGGCCKNGYVARQPSFGEFTGVHSTLLGDSGKPKYLSLRSESVPYPLSASNTHADLGRSDFGGHTSKSAQAADVRGLTAIEDSLDCAWLAVAISVHR